MSEADLLEKAIRLAVEAHHGQKDRYGQPYILHPLRVMHRVQTTAQRTVAVLHDVVEDTDWTLERLAQEGFPQEIVAAVECLTKRQGEPYAALIERARQNPLARRVKVADLEDNMDLRRLHQLHDDDLPRLQKYITAWHELS